jgi:hypothetical protein
MAESKWTRRGLLKGAAAAGATVAMPALVPGRVLGADGTVAPSDRIVTAGIGLANRGGHDLGWAMGQKDCQFVAICDVEKAWRDRVKARVDKQNGNADCATYRDLRELLARTDIDAIIMATSDRWHTQAAIMAMRAGKDVYSEKPPTMTIEEGVALMATQKRYGRVYQVGTQRRSEPHFVVADELLRKGRLGKIHTVHAHIVNSMARHGWLPAEPEPPKEELDWDLWLGPCPWRPFNRRYLHGWGGHLDFHTGGIGEWGSHTINHCQGAMGLDDTSGIEYEFPNAKNPNGMKIKYANGVTMILLGGQGFGPSAGWRGSCGVRYEGTEGWTAVADGYRVPDVSNPALISDYDKILADYRARTGRSLDHMRDFYDCVKSRRLCISHAEAAHRAMSTVHAANICMWLERNLKYDPVKEEFINDAEANRMRTRARRAPWTL